MSVQGETGREIILECETFFFSVIRTHVSGLWEKNVLSARMLEVFLSREGTVKRVENDAG